MSTCCKKYIQKYDTLYDSYKTLQNNYELLENKCNEITNKLDNFERMDNNMKKMFKEYNIKNVNNLVEILSNYHDTTNLLQQNSDLKYNLDFLENKYNQLKNEINKKFDIENNDSYKELLNNYNKLNDEFLVFKNNSTDIINFPEISNEKIIDERINEALEKQKIQYNKEFIGLNNIIEELRNENEIFRNELLDFKKNKKETTQKKRKF